MTRSTYVLALLVSSVALVGLAPAASAANDGDRRGARTVEPNPKIIWGAYRPGSQIRPNPRISWGRMTH